VVEVDGNNHAEGVGIITYFTNGEGRNDGVGF
jgi:hypothetical protein